MKLYSITTCPPSDGPSKLARMSIHEIEARLAERLERAWYFGWDEIAERIQTKLDALDELRLSY